MRKVEIINLPKIEDKRGNLSILEEYKQVPFKIKRTYWIYDVPGGQKRGGHAFKEQHEFIIALSGSLDVIIHDGKNEEKYSLNRSYYGLYVSNGLWRQMQNFSTNALALVLSSTTYDPYDYIYNFEYYKKHGIDEKK